MKPVIKFREPNIEFFSYDYHFSYGGNHNSWIGYASNSLKNLKEQIKALRLTFVWIESNTKNNFSYGQNIVDSYIYRPRYR